MAFKTYILGVAIGIALASRAETAQYNDADICAAVFAAMGKDKALLWKVTPQSTIVWYRNDDKGWRVTIHNQADYGVDSRGVTRFGMNSREKHYFFEHIQTHFLCTNDRRYEDRGHYPQCVGYLLRLEYDESFINQFHGIAFDAVTTHIPAALDPKSKKTEEPKPISVKPGEVMIHVGGKDIVWSDAGELPIDQCNQIALAAVPLRRGHGKEVVELLARKQRLTDPNILPYLIENLQGQKASTVVSCYKIVNQAMFTDPAGPPSPGTSATELSVPAKYPAQVPLYAVNPFQAAILIRPFAF